MKQISDELVESVQTFLGKGGLDFFASLQRDHGTVSPCLMDGSIPHPVHLREGMQVRNAMRRSGLCEDWDCHDLDNQWKSVVETAIEGHEID